MNSLPLMDSLTSQLGNVPPYTVLAGGVVVYFVAKRLLYGWGSDMSHVQQPVSGPSSYRQRIIH